MQMTYIIMMIWFALTSGIIAKETSKTEMPIQYGKASWYSVKCNHGTKTASGQRLSDSANTAAHKTIPLGTKVRVTNIKNGKSEIVQITDHGPYIKGRILDVTIGVAKKLGFVSQGITNVKIEIINKISS